MTQVHVEPSRFDFKPQICETFVRFVLKKQTSQFLLVKTKNKRVFSSFDCRCSSNSITVQHRDTTSLTRRQIYNVYDLTNPFTVPDLHVEEHTDYPLLWSPPPTLLLDSGSSPSSCAVICNVFMTSCYDAKSSNSSEIIKYNKTKTILHFTRRS